MTGSQIPVLLAILQDLIMGSTLVKCAAADLGIQWAGWALAAAFKTEKFYDLAGIGFCLQPDSILNAVSWFKVDRKARKPPEGKLYFSILQLFI